MTMDDYIDYVNDWYDCLNDVFEHPVSFALLAVYLEAITDTDCE